MNEVKIEQIKMQNLVTNSKFKVIPINLRG